MVYNRKCYHGTTLEEANSIVNEEKFDPSNGDEHWLGDGIYFFEDDPDMAREQAKARCYNRKSSRYGIMDSQVQSPEEYVFNLNEKDFRDVFHEHRKTLLEQMKRTKTKWQLNNKGDLDGKVINDICGFYPYKVIKGDFFIKRVNDRILGSFSRIPNCTIVCIREPEILSTPNKIEEGDWK